MVCKKYNKRISKEVKTKRLASMGLFIILTSLGMHMVMDGCRLIFQGVTPGINIIGGITFGFILVAKGWNLLNEFYT